MDVVTVFRSYNLADADLLRSRLEAAGFSAQVVHDFATLGAGAPISTGGVKVQVPADQVQDARTLIEAKNEE